MIHVIEGIASFSNFFQPSKFSNKFDTVILFERGSKEYKELESVIDKVGTERYTDKWATIKKGMIAAAKYPIKDGDAKAEKYAGYTDRLYISAKNEMRPRVVDRAAKPVLEDDGSFYPGAVIQAHIDVSVYENGFGKFIGLRLLGVQFVRDGERLATSAISTLSFKPLSDGAGDD